MIYIKDIITANGRYPERTDSADLTGEVFENIMHMKYVLFDFFSDLFQREPVEVISLDITSGFRPSLDNEATKNSAKKSLHLIGLAVDFSDLHGNMKNMIRANPDLLTKHHLWMEHQDFTPTWCHLDLGKRPERTIRIFRP